MSDLRTFLEGKFITVYDETATSGDGHLSPFAWGDVFLRTVISQPHQVILHWWPLVDTVILGMLDKQLPFFEDGLAVLKQASYQVVVRHIGGLAVVSDEGVLNFSLIFSQLEQPIGINQAYHIMADLIGEMFWDSPTPIAIFEITHSYCPGDYDLSIGGRKIAGLAQRRIKEGILVSIYLSVYGNQEKRGQLIRDFYDKGRQGTRTTVTYPDVWPESMTTLSEVYRQALSLEDVRKRLMNVLERYSVSISDHSLTESEQESYHLFLQEMVKRNKEVS